MRCSTGSSGAGARRRRRLGRIFAGGGGFFRRRFLDAQKLRRQLAGLHHGVASMKVIRAPMRVGEHLAGHAELALDRADIGDALGALLEDREVLAAEAPAQARWRCRAGNGAGARARLRPRGGSRLAGASRSSCRGNARGSTSRTTLSRAWASRWSRASSTESKDRRRRGRGAGPGPPAGAVSAGGVPGAADRSRRVLGGRGRRRPQRQPGRPGRRCQRAGFQV